MLKSIYAVIMGLLMVSAVFASDTNVPSSSATTEYWQVESARGPLCEGSCSWHNGWGTITAFCAKSYGTCVCSGLAGPCAGQPCGSSCTTCHNCGPAGEAMVLVNGVAVETVEAAQARIAKEALN